MRMQTAAAHAGNAATRPDPIALSADQWLDQVLRAHRIDGRRGAGEIVVLLASPTTAAARALAMHLPEIEASNLKVRVLLRDTQAGLSPTDESTVGAGVSDGLFASTCAKTVAHGRVANAHEFMVLGRARGWLGPSMAQASEGGNADGRDLTETAHVGLAWLAFEAIDAGAEPFTAGRSG